VGAFLIQHPVLGVAKDTVTEVFWVAVASSFINLLLVLFVFPESLSKEKQSKARGAPNGKGKMWASVDDTEQPTAPEGVAKTSPGGGIARGFLSPLAVFLPVTGSTPGGKDWSLTFLACTLWGYMLSTVRHPVIYQEVEAYRSQGIMQIRYLYAGHVYGWGAEQVGGSFRYILLQLSTMAWIYS
jgi:hypothetical protein